MWVNLRLRLRRTRLFTSATNWTITATECQSWLSSQDCDSWNSGRTHLHLSTATFYGVVCWRNNISTADIKTLDKLEGPRWPRITPRLFESATAGFPQQSDAWSTLLLVHRTFTSALFKCCLVGLEEGGVNPGRAARVAAVFGAKLRATTCVSSLRSCLCQTLVSYTWTHVPHLRVYVNTCHHQQRFASVLLILCIFVVTPVPVVCSLVQFNYAWCSSLVWSFVQLHNSQSSIFVRIMLVKEIRIRLNPGCLPEGHKLINALPVLCLRTSTSLYALLSLEYVLDSLVLLGRFGLALSFWISCDCSFVLFVVIFFFLGILFPTGPYWTLLLFVYIYF